MALSIAPLSIASLSITITKCGASIKRRYDEFQIVIETCNMLSVTLFSFFMLCVDMLNVIILSGVCLNVIVLSVVLTDVLLNVVTPNAVLLRVMAFAKA